MARTSIATDNFNRASLGADWTQQNTGNAGVISINSSTKAEGQYGVQPTDEIATVVWAGSGTFTDDQYASIKVLNVTSGGGSTDRVAATARASGTGASRSYYEAVCKFNSGGTPTIELAKWVTGTRTILHSAATALANNDTLEIEVEGTTVRVLKNGTALGGSFTQTDASISTGKPGFGATVATYGDDWDGGNITSGGSIAAISNYYSMMRSA